MDIHQERVKAKLALWDTPGFSQFIEDLSKYLGPEVNLTKHVETQKRLYKEYLDKLRKQSSKFKQGELPL